MSNFVTAEKAAEIVGVSRRTIINWARSHKIPGAFKQGEGRRGVWNIPLSELGGLTRDSRGKPLENRVKS